MRGRDGRGISIPGTYSVGGRRMAKPTGEARDSSLENDKAPGMLIQHAPRSSANPM